MAYKIKKSKPKAENITPYEEEVKTYANPETKRVMWIKRKYLGKGWYATYVDGELVDTSRNVGSSSSYVPEGYKEVSLFSEMSYHSGMSHKGKIDNYGTSNYTLQYSDYKPIGKYKINSPLKTQQKDEFGKLKEDVEFQEWNYAVLEKNSDDKFQFKHQFSNPYGQKKIVYTSKEYDAKSKNKAIKDFRNYVAKIKKEKN